MIDPRTEALQTLALSQRVLDELGRPTGRQNAPVSIHYYFALLYHCSVVRNIEFAARSREPAALYRLIPAFYRLYVESVVRRLRGDSDCRATPLWDAYFELADSLDRDRFWIGLPLLLRSGARAHIVGDLPEALALVLGAIRDPDTRGTASEELFGRASGQLYSAVMADFARALGEVSHLPPRPVAATLFRLCNGALRVPVVAGLQKWRRGALEQARLAMASTPPSLSPVPVT